MLSACAPQTPPAAPNTVYVVQAGDTLYSISNRFGVDQNAIVQLNGLKTPFLKVGQKIVLPSTAAVPPKRTDKPYIYIVQKGDFLAKIAKKYNTTVQAIKRQNGLTSNTIYPNQRLVIGEQASSPPASNSLKIVSTGQFITPVKGLQIQKFGTYKDGVQHEGINISAKLGDKVQSADSGRVVYTGNAISGYGNMILVSHAKGFVTVYAHLDTISVTQGSTVKQGQSLGTVGTTGAVDRPQLHFQLRLNQQPLDPNKYLR